MAAPDVVVTLRITNAANPAVPYVQEDIITALTETVAALKLQVAQIAYSNFS